uniref:Uncharacterized protein n=1 Tax=Lepeophtheirus salmonis TaxID=72036 RepID=A0A0K2UY68_LEPSM
MIYFHSVITFILLLKILSLLFLHDVCEFKKSFKPKTTRICAKHFADNNCN